jgi:ABC-2 type transport system ATP-binding protein
MLSAILRPTRGRASINGYDVVTDAAQVRRSIGLLTEQPGLYLRMTGLEYLQFYGRLYGLDDRESAARGLALFERFAMPGQAQRRLGEYSKGMRQKVGLIRAMLHRPAVLLLDEPTSAMDPHSARLVRDAIADLRASSRTIVLCTHNLAEAEQLADRIAIVRQGRIVAEGSAAALKRQLLGDPTFEVGLDRPVNGSLPSFPDPIQLETAAGTLLRFRTADPNGANPALVSRLAAAGYGVVTLREVTPSLEDVYLRVVGETAPADAA